VTYLQGGCSDRWAEEEEEEEEEVEEEIQRRWRACSHEPPCHAVVAGVERRLDGDDELRDDRQDLLPARLEAGAYTRPLFSSTKAPAV
jgi:hypothetical protein